MFRILLAFLFTTALYAQDYEISFSMDLNENLNDELSALEKGELKEEIAQDQIKIREIDAVTGEIIDEVSTGQAAIQKTAPKILTDEEILDPKNYSNGEIRERRIRSR